MSETPAPYNGESQPIPRGIQGVMTWKAFQDDLIRKLAKDCGLTFEHTRQKQDVPPMTEHNTGMIDLFPSEINTWTWRIEALNLEGEEDSFEGALTDALDTLIMELKETRK